MLTNPKRRYNDQPLERTSSGITNLQHLLLSHSCQLISVAVEVLPFDFRYGVLPPGPYGIIVKRLEINMLLHVVIHKSLFHVLVY
jgi:hypothetical protein